MLHILPQDQLVNIFSYCRETFCSIYTVSQKKGATLSMAITLSVLDRFAKFFHCCKVRYISNKT